MSHYHLCQCATCRLKHGDPIPTVWNVEDALLNSNHEWIRVACPMHPLPYNPRHVPVIQREAAIWPAFVDFMCKDPTGNDWYLEFYIERKS